MMPRPCTTTGAEAVTGWIFDIQRFCIRDGPGIRTTVFFLGCPLRCAWCHNPEGIETRPILSFVTERCIHCSRCAALCPDGAHRIEGKKHLLDRSRCQACGRCVDGCWNAALEFPGRESAAGAVFEQVLRDGPFYETTGGGMTLSGGEPLSQIDFADAMLRLGRRHGLHCAVETCGLAPWDHIERIRSNVDLFLYDVKNPDPSGHRANTGADNRAILDNLRELHDSGARIRLRYPLVGGHNDSDANLAALVELGRSLPNIEGLEVLPYHPLHLGKLGRFGLVQMDAGAAPPEPQTMARWIDALKASGLPVMEAGA
jgi:glycyl-radical enzyme activating protein